MSLVSQQEVAEHIKLLEAAKKDYGDAFTVKVMRRNGAGDPYPAQWAAFGRATMSQVINRELWLERLIPRDSGGVYELTVLPTQQSDRIVVMGAFPVFKEGSTRGGPPDLTAFHASDWNGPNELLYPREVKPAGQASGAVVLNGGSSVNGVSVNGQTLQQPTVSTQDARNAVANDTASATANKLLDAAAQLEKQRLALTEERHKFELETLKKSNDAQMSELKNQMMRMESLLNQPRAEVKSQSITEQLPTLLAAITPLIGLFLKSGEDKQQFMVAMFDKNAEKQNAAMEKLLDAIKSKPLGDENNSKMLTQMMEALAQSAKLSFQVIHQAREVANADAGAPPNPIVDGIGRIAEAVEKTAASYFGMLQKRPVFVTPGQQANGTVNGVAVTQQNTQQHQPQQLPPQTQQQNQDPTALPEMESNIIPAAANVVPFTPKASVDTTPPPSKSLVNIKEMMLKHEDPAKVVAAIFEGWANDKEFEAEVTAVGGDPTELFLKHIGETWLKADAKNIEYAQKVGALLVEEAQKRGMVSPEEKGEEESAATENPTPTS